MWLVWSMLMLLGIQVAGQPLIIPSMMPLKRHRLIWKIRSIANNATVRAAAKQFGVSKSTVHKDLTERLEKIDPALYQQVRQLLDRNKAERHIRGGMATRRKYKGT